MSRKKYTTAQVQAAMTGTRGIVAQLARNLGADWHTAKKATERNQTLTRAWEAEREAALDTAEIALYDAIEGGEPWAVKFLLSTIGKRRGYTERHEVENTGEGPTIVLDWGEADLKKSYVTISPDDWDTDAATPTAIEALHPL